MSRIEILQRQEQQEDTTPLSAESPHRTANAGSPRMNTTGKAMIGFGALIARRGTQVAVGEIEARGNEQLARDIQIATRIGAYASAIIATKGVAAVPIVANEGIQAIQTNLNIRRENTMTEIKNRLRGNLVTVGDSRD